MTERLVICSCRWRKFISQEKLSELVAHAEAEGREVEYVDDLCELMEKGDEAEVSRLAKGTIAACHKRAVRSLLLWRGVEVKELIDLREGIGDTGPGDDAWYPVIDKDRCTECGKCFDFCPFGVYEMVDDRVRVVNPTNCKNNCPACARNCPSEAIIFPKYGRSPINGGAEQEEQALRVDHSMLYADAFRARLLERRNFGTPLFKDDSKSKG